MVVKKFDTAKHERQFLASIADCNKNFCDFFLNVDAIFETKDSSVICVFGYFEFVNTECRILKGLFNVLYRDFIISSSYFHAFHI